MDRKRLLSAFPRQILAMGDYSKVFQQPRRFEQGAHPTVIGTVTFVLTVEYEFDYLED